MNPSLAQRRPPSASLASLRRDLVGVHSQRPETSCEGHQPADPARGERTSNAYGAPTAHVLSHLNRIGGTALRCERERPGELVHINVKTLGKIPDCGGWPAHSREAASPR